MQKTMKNLIPDSKQAVDYMVREIRCIIEKTRPRDPGGEGERKAAAYMAEVLKNDCGCTRVSLEPFKEHPSAFYGYFYFSTAFDTLCAVCSMIDPWLSLLFGLLGLALFIVHFVAYKRVIDPLFPVRESANVTAIRPCAGEVRQRVFLNGHMDASWEFTLNYHFGGIVFEIPGVMATIGVLFYVALAVFTLCGAGAWVRTAACWGLIFIPFFLLLSITYNPNRVVDGANDNLSGCYMGITLLREMERHGIELEHTELGVILTASEEAGLRGAKAWCEAHKSDFRDVPTSIVCFDTIHNSKQLAVNTRDLNGTVPADTALCKAFLQAAEAAGVPCRESEIPLFGGATDSAAFTQGGFRSVGITGLSHKLEDYYHTRRDTYDYLNREGLESCYKAAATLIDMMDHSIERTP